jgi:hypothetical protein
MDKENKASRFRLRLGLMFILQHLFISFICPGGHFLYFVTGPKTNTLNLFQSLGIYCE